MEANEPEIYLLALLLTLKHTQTPLNPETQTRLYELGERLQNFDPKRWPIIKRTIHTLLNTTPNLTPEFQKHLATLQNHPLDRLPALTLPIDPNTPTIEKRGIKPGSPSTNNTQYLINDLVIPTLLNDNPIATSQKLTGWQRFWQPTDPSDDYLPPLNP